MPMLECHILILNVVSASMFFALGKVIGMVRLRTIFILSSQAWKIGSPPAGSARRVKITCVVPASVVHI